MNIDLNDLHKTLTSETLAATDRLCAHLQTTSTRDYDRLFSIVFDRLKPLLIEDHAIEVEVRAQLFRGIVERTPLDPHIQTALEQSYIDFIQTNASQELQSFAANNTTIKKLASVSPETPLSFFYGQWMPEMPLKEALKYMETPIQSAMDNLRCDIARRPTQQQRAAYLNMSVDDKCKKILKLYNDEYRNMDRFKFAVETLKSHPKFNDLLNYVLSEADYANDTLIGHPLMNFDNYLTVSQQPLMKLKNEIVSLNDQFQEKKITTIGDLWVSDIVDRCKNLLHSMAKEHVVTVSKSSIEQFRAKDPHKEPIEDNHFQTPQRV